jgi:hypothetical protein
MVGIFCTVQGLSCNSQSIVDYVPLLLVFSVMRRVSCNSQSIMDYVAVWLVYSVLCRVCLVTHRPRIALYDLRVSKICIKF